MKSLADRLGRCPQIAEKDEPGRNEAGTLVHALSDIEDSCHAYLERHLPALMRADLEGDDLIGVLIELAEELRHIVYHCRDSRFLRPLVID